MGFPEEPFLLPCDPLHSQEAMVQAHFLGCPVLACALPLGPPLVSPKTQWRGCTRPLHRWEAEASAAPADSATEWESHAQSPQVPRPSPSRVSRRWWQSPEDRVQSQCSQTQASGSDPRSWARGLRELGAVPSLLRASFLQRTEESGFVLGLRGCVGVRGPAHGLTERPVLQSPKPAPVSSR